MTTVTLTLEAAQQVFALISKLDITDFTPDSDAREQAIAIMQAAIEAKPAVHLAHEQKNWRQMLGDVGGWDNELVSVPAGGVRKIIEEVEMLRASYEQAPARELTQPDLQRLWNDAMYANRQSTTDAAMEFGFAVQAASKSPLNYTDADCEASEARWSGKLQAPQECQTEAEKRAYAFGWWKALESVRARELSDADIDAVTRRVYGTKKGWSLKPHRDYARAVLSASKTPEQKLEPLAGGWGVD